MTPAVLRFKPASDLRRSDDPGSRGGGGGDAAQAACVPLDPTPFVSPSGRGITPGITPELTSLPYVLRIAGSTLGITVYSSII
mmetsp:Transcript_79488/g.226964  ORF Transcript_79488/g.226964 Transcript_79488/m.226964 type:complete len:83 (+) Transcript_79488:156-404(+)